MYMYVSVKNDANAADTNEGMKGWGGGGGAILIYSVTRHIMTVIRPENIVQQMHSLLEKCAKQM